MKKLRTIFHSFLYLLRLDILTPGTLMQELANNLDEFDDYLRSEVRRDYVVVIVSILAKICLSGFRYNKINVLKVTINRSFMSTLIKYVKFLNEKGRYTCNDSEHVVFWKNPDKVFLDLLAVCDAYTDIISYMDYHILLQLLNLIKKTVEEFERKSNVNVSQETKSNIAILRQKVILRLKRTEPYNMGNSPLNNFRRLNIFPTSEEVLTPNYEWTSNNIVEGRYHDVEHYLNVHFQMWKRVFREPLRQYMVNCMDHVKTNPNNKHWRLRIHSGVSFKSFFIMRNEIRATIKFSNQESKEDIVNLDSLGFSDGMIISFTKDNFSSIFLGRIIRCGVDQEELNIVFEPKYSNYDVTSSYTIVVCNAYFDQCYYVLKHFQSMSESDFPMKKYLVDADPTPEKPDYLAEKEAVYIIADTEVNLFGNKWPRADLLKLDRFQYSAFKAALTQKFCVIQGAPGTGKTHLGLQIVKTLLHESNKKYWYNDAPILILTLKSESLQQILQGLISIDDNKMQVSKQITNGELISFALGNVNTTNLSDYNTITHPCSRKSKILEDQIHTHIQVLILINDLKNIINFKHFSVIDKNIESSWFSGASNNELFEWLFVGYKSQNINPYSIEISEILSVFNEEHNKYSQGNDDDGSAEERIISTHSEYDMLISQSKLVNEMGTIIENLKLARTIGTRVHTSGTGNIKEMQTKLQYLWQIFQYLKMRTSNRAFSTNPIKPDNTEYQSPHRMAANDRWDLYFYWLNLYKIYVEKQCVELQHIYHDHCLELEEISNICHLETIGNIEVLGITFAKASNIKTLLQYFKCRIVVVEDVSEVLESYLVPFLTKHCQHLIIMGNHQRLSPAIPDIFTKSGISMMECMIRNKMQYHILGVQYRMKNQISKLLVPHIYPEIENHRSEDVNLPIISGIASSMFFIHLKRECIKQYDQQIKLYRAKYLISLARYLVTKGYQSKYIAILTDCLEQAMILRREIRKYRHMSRIVKICDFNNYWESRRCSIILLSLVRTTFAGETDVLKYECSLVYSFSLAWKALYMIGDINLLCENSVVWRRIKEVLMKKNCLNDYLPISNKIKIEKPEDFDKLIDGV